MNQIYIYDSFYFIIRGCHIYLEDTDLVIMKQCLMLEILDKGQCNKKSCLWENPSNLFSLTNAPHFVFVLLFHGLRDRFGFVQITTYDSVRTTCFFPFVCVGGVECCSHTPHIHLHRSPRYNRTNLSSSTSTHCNEGFEEALSRMWFLQTSSDLRYL